MRHIESLTWCWRKMKMKCAWISSPVYLKVLCLVCHVFTDTSCLCSTSFACCTCVTLGWINIFVHSSSHLMRPCFSLFPLLLSGILFYSFSGLCNLRAWVGYLPAWSSPGPVFQEALQKDRWLMSFLQAVQPFRVSADSTSETPLLSASDSAAQHQRFAIRPVSSPIGILVDIRFWFSVGKPNWLLLLVPSQWSMLTPALCSLSVVLAGIQSELPEVQLAAQPPQPELEVHQSIVFADNLSDVQLSVSCSSVSEPVVECPIPSKLQEFSVPVLQLWCGNLLFLSWSSTVTSRAAAVTCFCTTSISCSFFSATSHPWFHWLPCEPLCLNRSVLQSCHRSLVLQFCCRCSAQFSRDWSLVLPIMHQNLILISNLIADLLPNLQWGSVLITGLLSDLQWPALNVGLLRDLFCLHNFWDVLLSSFLILVIQTFVLQSSYFLIPNALFHNIPIIQKLPLYIIPLVYLRV